MRLLVATWLCSCSMGCLLWSGERVPNLIGSGAKPTLAVRPRIELVLHHIHTLDGKDAGGTAADATYEAFEESLERVRGETPFLANAGIGIAEPEYVLDLQTEVAEHGKTGAIVTGATLFLYPGFPRSEVIVRAHLEDASGRLVGRYDASGELKGVMHLLLLPALPVTLLLAPGDELYDDTFRDVFLLVERDLGRHTAPQAGSAPGSRLQPRRRAPSGTSRRWPGRASSATSPSITTPPPTRTSPRTTRR
jgi:hypothetical protein